MPPRASNFTTWSYRWPRLRPSVYRSIWSNGNRIPKAAKSNTYCYKRRSNSAALAMSVRLCPSLTVNRSRCGRIAAGSAELSKPSSARLTWTELVMVAGAAQAFIRWTRTCRLPERSFSYELQRRLVQAAIQGPIREATARILDCTGLTIHNHSLEPLLIEAAADFDGFYQQRTADPSQPSASLLVVAVDCKGIPMVKPEPIRPPVRIAKE